MYHQKEANAAKNEGELVEKLADQQPLPPPPALKKSPNQLQKRRAKVYAGNNKQGTTITIDDETDSKDISKSSPEKRRVTRSKSVVDIMKIHSSTSSIPGAVENEETSADADELQRGLSGGSLPANGNGRQSLEKAKFDNSDNQLTGQRKLSKLFTSDSAIFQETIIHAPDEASVDENEYLPPDHPLMKRYQSAITDHLMQQKEQLRSELRQSEDLLKKKQREFERVGREAYTIRQELEKLRRAIVEKDQILTQVAGEKNSLEEHLAPLQLQLASTKAKIEELLKAEKQAKDELRRLNTGINELLSDVAITNHMTIARNAVKKAQQDLVAIEQDKSRQETMTARLLEAAARKENELQAIDEDIRAVTAELAEKRENLLVLNAETQSISMEKRNLLQRWNATLKGMRKRDEEFAEVQTALRNHQQTASRVESELSGLAKVYANVRESNEKLIGTLVRLQDEVERCTTLVNNTSEKSASIDAECGICQQTLEELLLQKASIQKEKVALTHTLGAVKAKLRLEQQEIMKLEDAASDYNSNYQTNDKSIIAVSKQLEKLRRETRESEKSCGDLEAELEKESQLWMDVESSLQTMKGSYEELKEEMFYQSKLMAQQELEQDALVSKRLSQIEVSSKKINAEIKQKQQQSEIPFGTKMNSVRYESESIQKKMNACDERVAKLQKEWMKLQDQLIRASEAIEKENSAIVAILTAQTELEQMKIRLQGEIEANEEEETLIKRRMDQMHLTIAKLNDMITKKLGAKAALESDHLVTFGQFSGMLKDAELDCVQMEDKLAKKLKEKHRVENAMQEAESQLRIWEQKVAEARDAKTILVSGQDQEYHRMLADVHRMQIRLGQLTKQQETTIKEMEKAVSKRNVLLQKGEAVTAAKTVQLTQTQLNHAVTDLRRKVKQFQKDLEAAEREEEECRNTSESSAAAIESKVTTESEVMQRRAQLAEELSKLQAIQFKNSHLLSMQQMRHKRLEDARDGRYDPLCKDASVMEEKRRKEAEKRESLIQLVNTISSTYPHLAGNLKKIEGLLNI